MHDNYHSKLRRLYLIFDIIKKSPLGISRNQIRRRLLNEYQIDISLRTVYRDVQLISEFEEIAEDKNSLLTYTCLDCPGWEKELLTRIETLEKENLELKRKLALKIRNNEI